MDRKFPQPERRNGRRYWRLSDLVAWERGEDAARAMREADEVWLTAKQVRERYGNISDMTLHRWLREGENTQPEPAGADT